MQIERPIEAEFPLIDLRAIGLRHRQVVHATEPIDGLWFWHAVATTDVESGTEQRLVYGPQTLVEEHVFMANAQHPAKFGGLDPRTRTRKFGRFVYQTFHQGSSFERKPRAR